MKRILMFGNTIINTDDIVEIEEKEITFSISHTKENPKPKPKNFFKKLVYSDTITYFEEEKYFCLVLKVKGKVQMRGKTDDNGNVSMTSNQLYDFFAVYNNEKLATRVQQDLNENKKDSVCEMGNFFVYFGGVLAYPDYLKTNTLLDKSINSKQEFINKYM